MFLIHMLLEVFILSLNRGFFSRTNETSILLLILDFFLKVS